MGALDFRLHDNLIYEMKNKDGKGGKYSEKGIIFFAGEKKNREGYGGKYLEKDNTFLRRRRKMEKEKEENIWRRKIFGGGKYNLFRRRRKILAKENFTITGETNNRTRKDRATQPMDHGRLR